MKMKQARVEEHRSMLRLCPGKQRISMISGIGLRFRKGKPIIGDVWNTSPSSSDISSCYSPKRHGRVYSREVTPSDDGVCGYSEGETFPLRRATSYIDVDTTTHQDKTDRKGWEIGGEPVEGRGGHKSANSDSSSIECLKQSSGNSGSPSPAAQEATKRPLGNHNPSPSAVLTTSMADNIATDRLFRTFRAGGGVDDGGGGSGKSDTSGSQDAVTQTDFEDVYFNMTTGERINNPYSTSSNYNTYPPPNSINSWAPSSAQPRRRESVDVGKNIATPLPFLGLIPNSNQPMVVDMRPRLSRDESVGGAMKPSGKRRPSLRIDLLAAPHSPTTELVAQDHGFALEGLDVPHYSGGSRSLPSSGSDIFKPKDSRKSSHASIKPLSPSPAILSRINVMQDTPPLRQHHNHHHHHHHRTRRPETLDVMFSNASSKAHPSKKHSHGGHHLKPSRATSLSPGTSADNERHSAMTLKVPERVPEPRTAPIPKHFYHQDEEGFFSSSHSSNYNSGRTFSNEADGSRRGILFFSRLAGAGRVSSNAAFDSSVGSSSGVAYGLGKPAPYKSGGFES
ncbi:serine/arginine repetitive matrix protein 1 [Biomphalaria pfeifferi]|uniref:Serine/arginine repetitive matrix protein 1 n=1 Tax=Biomphalaria pfeifferi TaxID=112525 RepID=A0AAD8FK71_BIOPF|nr:serine/arginine repetitive matrix protein 1 [Biomphalaria pfeifferi]